MDHHIGIIILVSVSLALLLGAMVRYVLKDTVVPYTVALLVIGLVIGFVDRALMLPPQHILSYSIDQLSSIDPHLILFIFLPILIFESAFAIEAHLFKRTFSQISILAVPGLLISTGLTACLVMYVFPWDWGWPVALLFGALISATDPVAVVALLKEMSSRKRLETLIEGESLLNDGTAIVLFTVFLGFVGASAAQQIDALSVGFGFIKVVALGLIIGLATAFIIINWMTRIFNDPMLETTLSIVAAYLAFYVAEGLLHVSGVVAVVTLALTLSSVGRTKISPEVEGFLHHFWEMMAYVANTLIFLLVGIIIAHRIQVDNVEAWQTLAILYLGILLIRAFSITLFTPVLKRIGIGLTKEKVIVMIWGGLRGAVALALALSVAQNELFPPAVRDQILFLSAGIVVLTILVNGSSIRWLLKFLGLDSLPAAKQATVDRAEISINRELSQATETLSKDSLLARANWQQIRQEFVKPVVEDPPSTDAHQDEDLLVAFKRRILEAERKHYWCQFADGTLTAHAVNALVDATELALDGEPEIHPRQALTKYWQLPKFASWLLQSPILKTWCQRWGHARLFLTYDIARGFLIAQQESLKHLQQLQPPQAIQQQIADEIGRNITNTESNLQQLQQQFPETVRELETFVAKRLLLNQRRTAIKNLAGAGVLDTPEAERLTHDVEKQMQKLAKQMH